VLLEVMDLVILVEHTLEVLVVMPHQVVVVQVVLA
jgi:hypothetical protein